MLQERLARQVLLATPAGKRSQRLIKHRLAWSPLRCCLVPSWCGASRTADLTTVRISRLSTAENTSCLQLHLQNMALRNNFDKSTVTFNLKNSWSRCEKTPDIWNFSGLRKNLKKREFVKHYAQAKALTSFCNGRFETGQYLRCILPITAEHQATRCITEFYQNWLSTVSGVVCPLAVYIPGP